MSVPNLFILKRNDRSPGIEGQLLDSNGKPLPLTGKTVTFRMKPIAGGAYKVSGGLVTVLDALRAVVRYVFAAGETDTLGDFNAEFVVMDAGLPQTVPSSGYVLVRIEPSLDDVA